MLIKDETKEKIEKLVEEGIDSADTLQDARTVIVAAKMIEEKIDKSETEAKEAKAKADLEKAKLNISKCQLNIEKLKLDLANKELDIKEEENKLKLLAIGGTILSTVITVVGAVTVKLITIKHQDKIYQTELYMNYHDSIMSTPTQKEISRFCLQDSMKDR